MILSKQLYEMKRGHWLFINFPTINHMLAGTERVGIRKDGTIKIKYQDGAEEERKANSILRGTEVEDITLFQLVSFVQEGRKVQK